MGKIQATFRAAPAARCFLACQNLSITRMHGCESTKFRITASQAPLTGFVNMALTSVVISL
jgi:hypothetical protein